MEDIFDNMQTLKHDPNDLDFIDRYKLKKAIGYRLSFRLFLSADKRSLLIK